MPVKGLLDGVLRRLATLHAHARQVTEILDADADVSHGRSPLKMPVGYLSNNLCYSHFPRYSTRRTSAEAASWQVMRTLEHLASQPPEQWSGEKVHLRSRKDSLYMLDATDQLRVFFRRDKDGTLTIFNLAMQEALDLYVANTPVGRMP